MTATNAECQICGTPADFERLQATNINQVNCSACGVYFYADSEIAMYQDGLFGEPADRGKASALLFERKTFNPQALPPLITMDIASQQSGFMCTSVPPRATPVCVRELLANWAQSVPDQLDRAISLLARLFIKAGDEFKPEDNGEILPSRWLLAEDGKQASFLQDHLLKRAWIERAIPLTNMRAMRITPGGWKRVAELTRRSARTNPAFIARWFGKPKAYEKDQTDRSADMAALLRVIETAIEDAGFRSTKADSEDYNTGIMDKVPHDIRRAPFVVADFTNPNLGVYYEAGVAVGHGIPVIP